MSAGGHRWRHRSDDHRRPVDHRQHIAVWQRRLPKRIASTGAAVGCVDHLSKNRDGQGRYAIGGQHKLAGVTGATYRFTVSKPLRRALSEPMTGRVTISVEKDRPGWVRARADGDAVRRVLRGRRILSSTAHALPEL